MKTSFHGIRWAAAGLLCGLIASSTLHAADNPFGSLGAAAATAGKATVGDLASQFARTAVNQPDKLLGAVGGDLVTKLKSLDATLGVGDALKSQLTGSLQSLIGGKDSDALTAVFALSQAANLTPEQKGLAKDVSNLATAYVVQRNFSSLEGADGDVATIVKSLRKGELAPAIPAIQKVSQNASLTAPQKQLITSVAGKYAPGLKKAKDTLQQGLHGLHDLPAFGK
jgi:hypothetical protein